MNTSIDISMIHFDEKGLVPAIVQEENGEVLMLAYMNEESLKKTLETGFTWFYSRSREKLWRVHQAGGACHTGTYSCFSGRRLGKDEKGVAVIGDEPQTSLAEVLNAVYHVIQERRVHPVEGSYTNYLFDKGQDKILKKVGEEAAETIIASKNMEKSDILYEMGDLWYHCLVLLAFHNIVPDELFVELMNRRSGGSYHQFTGKDGVRPDV